MTGRSCAATGQRPQRPAREMDSQPAVLRPGCRAGLRHDIPHRRRHPEPVPPSRHPVSSLALRPRGRVVTANFAVTGTLVLAGAAGWGRAADPAPASREGFKDASLVPAMGILPVRLCQPVARAIGAFRCESPCHPGQHGFRNPHSRTLRAPSSASLASSPARAGKLLVKASATPARTSARVLGRRMSLALCSASRAS